MKHRFSFRHARVLAALALILLPLIFCCAGAEGLPGARQSVEYTLRLDLRQRLVGQNATGQNTIAMPSGLTQADKAAISSAVSSLRSAMVNREATVSVEVNLSSTAFFPDTISLASLITEQAYANIPGTVTGDYLNWHLHKVVMIISWSDADYTIDYEMDYYTTAAQESAVGAFISRKLASFAFTDQTPEYDKVRTIYDCVRDTVSYDYAHLNDSSYLLKQSAYAAAINGTAVCQGYATLLYRFLRSAGIDCRVVVGLGGGGAHAWNLIRVDGQYYYADATWDDGRTDYAYFLRGSTDFPRHTPDSELADFLSSYSIAKTKYVVPEITSLTAVFNQTNTVYTSNDIESLRAMLTVSGVTRAGAAQTDITAYTLEGPLTAGTCTVTASYGGIKTTFTVTVTAVAPDHLTATLSQNALVYPVTPLDKLRPMLAVAIFYNDGTKREAISTYTLQGTLTPGQSTVTVSAEGVSTTCGVQVTKVTDAFTLPFDTMLLGPGDHIALNAKTLLTGVGTLQWACDEKNVLTVAPGWVTVVGLGEAHVRVWPQDAPEAVQTCVITVRDMVWSRLPQNLTSIRAEAFSGAGFKELIISDSIKSIGEKAFSGCDSLARVWLPDGEISIAADAFPEDVIILCADGSAAQAFAAQYGYDCYLTD